MRYYVDGVDPTTGQVLVPERGPRQRAKLTGNQTHLVELAPSRQLLTGYQAAQRLAQASAAGDIPERSWAALRAWADISQANAATMYDAMEFLQGRKIEEIDTIFAERYRQELAEPQAWPALAILTCDPAPEIVSYLPVVREVLGSHARAMCLACGQSFPV